MTLTIRGLVVCGFLAAANTAFLRAVVAFQEKSSLSAEDSYDLAAHYYQQQRWELAAQEFRSFLQRFPNHSLVADGRFYLGETFVQLRKFSAAHEEFVKFLQQRPQHRWRAFAQFRIGETLYLSGKSPKKLAEAKEKLVAFDKAYPKHHLGEFVLPYLAEITLAAGDAKQAENYFSQALQEFPQGGLREECQLGLARALEQQGDRRSAMRFLQFLIENKGRLADAALFHHGRLLYEQNEHPSARGKWRRLLDDYPQSEWRVEAHYWTGRAHFSESHWKDAATSLAKAHEIISQRPVPATTSHSLAADVVFWLGESERRQGNAADAKDRYTQVLEKWPQSQWADDSLQALVQINFDKENDSEVERLANEFSQQFPQSKLRDFVLQTYGRSLLRRRRYEQAVQVFQGLLTPAAKTGQPQGVKDDDAASNSSRNWYYLALAELGREQFQPALLALQRAGADREITSGVLWAQSAAFLGLKQYKRAEKALREYLVHLHVVSDALRLDKSNLQEEEIHQAQARLAIVLTHQGRRAEAKSALDQIPTTGPTISIRWPVAIFLADTAYEKKDFDLAGSLYGELALADDPQFAAPGLCGQGWVYWGATQYEQAADVFGRLSSKYAEHTLAPEASLMQARALDRLQRQEEALSAFEHVWRRYAKTRQAPQALVEAARLHDRAQQKEQAAQLFELAVKDYPNFSQLDAALYEWAWTLADLGHPKKADEIFERLWRDHRTSQFWADAAYRLAERAARAKNYARAKTLAEEILQSPKNRPRPQDVRAHALYLKGQLAAVERRWEDVAAPMTKLLQQSPQSPLALSAKYWLAEADYRLDKLNEAQTRFAALSEETAGRRESWLAMLPLRRAQILCRRRQWLEAYELAAAISHTYPQFRQLYEVDYVLGRCLAGRGQFQKARAAYERVLRSPDGGRTETAAMAQWMIGETHLHQKNYDEAIRAFDRVVALFDYPRWQAGALLQAGKCYEQKRQPREAIRFYAQLLKDYPDSPFAEEASRRLKQQR